MSDHIDPEEFPFTTDELFQAGCRFLTVDTARTLADHMTERGPTIVRTRFERRAEWKAAGVPDADNMLLHAWAYPDELLPALASLSADVEIRARRLLEDAWELQRRSMVHVAQRTAAERAGIVPTREEIMKQLARDDVSPLKGNRARNVASVKLPSIPPPTAEMHAAADAHVQTKRRELEVMIARFRASAANE